MITFVFGTVLIAAVIYGQSWVIEFAIVKRIMDSPARGFVVSLLASGVLTIVWAGLAFGFTPGAFLAPATATALIFALSYRRYAQLRAKEQADIKLFE